jgi:CRISPR-associated protein Cas6
MESEPKVDLCFQSLGQTLPVDHGFALYGAISRVLPAIHEDVEIGLKLIRGRYIGDGILDISPYSELVLRLPTNKIGQYLKIAGKSLDISSHKLTIGVPKTKALIPAVALFAQLVTTKNGHDQNRFEAEIKTQMEKMNVEGKLTVEKRRTFQVHGKQVVGYSVLATELTAEESITLQENGLGGRRKMGCGFFEVWEG